MAAADPTFIAYAADARSAEGHDVLAFGRPRRPRSTPRWPRTAEKGAGEIVDLDGEGLQSSDGVAVETGGDGSFPVYVTYGDDGVRSA